MMMMKIIICTTAAATDVVVIVVEFQWDLGPSNSHLFLCKRTFSICSLLLLVLFSLSRLVTGRGSSSGSRRWGRLACLGQVFSHYAFTQNSVVGWGFFFPSVFWGFTPPPPQLELHPRRGAWIFVTNKQTNKQASKASFSSRSVCVEEELRGSSI